MFQNFRSSFPGLEFHGCACFTDFGWIGFCAQSLVLIEQLISGDKANASKHQEPNHQKLQRSMKNVPTPQTPKPYTLNPKVLTLQPKTLEA